MEEEWKVIASKMLTGSERNSGAMHNDLYFELSCVNTMCERAGGRLRSRQVIAAIIANWEKRTGLNAIPDA